uniref:Glycine-rich protein n=1 Tax=Cannabis sativa TaxID=3483 RepID=A0A803QJS8_CANSA
MGTSKWVSLSLLVLFTGLHLSSYTLADHDNNKVEKARFRDDDCQWGRRGPCRGRRGPRGPRFGSGSGSGSGGGGGR